MVISILGKRLSCRSPVKKKTKNKEKERKAAKREKRNGLANYIFLLKNTMNGNK